MQQYIKELEQVINNRMTKIVFNYLTVHWRILLMRKSLWSVSPGELSRRQKRTIGIVSTLCFCMNRSFKLSSKCTYHYSACKYNRLIDRDLTMLQERQQKKCERLEQAVREDTLVFYQEVQTLQEHNRVGRNYAILYMGIYVLTFRERSRRFKNLMVR